MSRPKLTYKITLNGVELTDVSIGVSTIDKFEEPLDDGSFRLPFTAVDYQYEMRGLLSIYVNDGTDDLQFDYLIMSDNVSAGSKYGEWIHDLNVMEYTHKLDMYLIHSLVKTKSIINKNPAPFEIVANDYNNNSGSLDYSAFVRANFEPLEIKTTYYDDETITINQVREVYQVTQDVEWNDYMQSEAYITVKELDGTVAVAQHEISLAEKSFVLDAGNYYIEYGFNATPYDMVVTGGYTAIYRYYIQVIEREDLSVYNLVNLVRQSISKFGGIESKLYYDDTRIFDIDPTIVDYLKSVEAPQTFIQKATARQVLNGIFQYINSISRLRWVEDDNDLLTIDRFNDTTGDFSFEDVSGYGSSQDARSLANKGFNWLEQVLPNNLEEATLKSPSEGNFKTIRSTNIQITDTQFELKLERPIYQLKKLEAVIENMEYGFGGLTTITENYDGFVLDLTPRVINKEEWDLKLTTVNFPEMELQNFWSADVGMRENKVGNLYWRQGDTSIKLADPYGDVIQENLFKNVIEEAIYEHFVRYTPEPEFDGSDKMAKLNFLDFTLPPNIVGSSNYIRFNIEYITLENINAQVEREDISYSPYYTEARINQSAKVLNIANATRKSYGELQRSGVPDITFSKHHESISDILTVGLKNDDGYVIVQRKLEFHNEYIYATYVATKDHNRIAQFVGLDQAYRWAEIPTSNQIYERIESYTDYIVLSEPSDTLMDADTTKIKGTGAFNAIFGTLMNDWGSTSGFTKITLAYVRTDGFLEIYPDDDYASGYYYAIMTPVASFGVKGGFVFGFGFENNQVAGNSIITSTRTSDSATLFWNNAIRYTNEQGTFNELWFQLSPKFSVNLTADAGWTQEEADSNYPLIRTDLTVPYGSALDRWYYSGTRLPSSADNDSLVIYKDRSQNIKISYQNTLLSYVYQEYIFGQSFFANNFIVKNPNVVYNEVVGTPMYLYTYEDGTKYNKFEDLKVKSGYETPILLVESSNVSFSSRKFRFIDIDLSSVTSWAIGDGDGNLYLACNDNHNGFNVTAFHFRPNLLEIGKTE